MQRLPISTLFLIGGKSNIHRFHRLSTSFMAVNGRRSDGYMMSTSTGDTLITAVNLRAKHQALRFHRLGMRPAKFGKVRTIRLLVLGRGSY